MCADEPIEDVPEDCVVPLPVEDRRDEIVLKLEQAWEQAVAELFAKDEAA